MCDDVDLCVECLGSGQVIPKQHHSPHHAYRIIGPMAFPIAEGDWRADEDLALMEAIETCGMGNWEDVAEALGNRRLPTDCQERYRFLFLDWPGAPALVRILFNFSSMLQTFFCPCRIRKDF